VTVEGKEAAAGGESSFAARTLRAARLDRSLYEEIEHAPDTKIAG
jgi:hypothetical protein